MRHPISGHLQLFLNLLKHRPGNVRSQCEVSRTKFRRPRSVIPNALLTELLLGLLGPAAVGRRAAGLGCSTRPIFTGAWPSTSSAFFSANPPTATSHSGCTISTTWPSARCKQPPEAGSRLRAACPECGSASLLQKRQRTIVHHEIPGKKRLRLPNLSEKPQSRRPLTSLRGHCRPGSGALGCHGLPIVASICSQS